MTSQLHVYVPALLLLFGCSALAQQPAAATDETLHQLAGVASQLGGGSATFGLVIWALLRELRLVLDKGVTVRTVASLDADSRAFIRQMVGRIAPAEPWDGVERRRKL